MAPLPNDHPLNIIVRTYPLALFLSLAPALVSSATSPKARSKGLISILRRELSPTGFPFAITIALGGGSALRTLWKRLDQRQAGSIPRSESGSHLKPWQWQKSFISNALASFVAITVLQHRRRSGHAQNGVHIPLTVPISHAPTVERGRMSATLDLTLLVLVRAFDALLQGLVFRRTGEEKKQERKRRLAIASKLDALAFWACSAGIMWCFFYEPGRLPSSYVKWISSLANIDDRIVGTLRAIRAKRWSYVHGTSLDPNPASVLSKDLGYPAQWGDPSLLPAYGGNAASAVWNILGVRGRGPVGGLPCEIVHGSVTGGSCTANFVIRGLHAFLEGLALYVPVHVLPILIRRPQRLLNFQSILDTLLGILRSASFLSAFVSSFWAAVCLTRTLVVARALPKISHDFYDGPFGCVMAGCLACGSSIWIESGRRRGEIALYVLPRAIRACFPDRWLRSGRKSVYAIERIVFTASLATLLTAAVHHPETLRGLSRWTLGFVLQGPNALRLRRKNIDPSEVRRNTTPTPDKSARTSSKEPK
ncbi:hypothetical protein BC827DRAFT_1143868 [Russula dissimulans]|nr:hypothetical protein BC827DRAFT_1143868 [Russula dissimulans]